MADGKPRCLCGSAHLDGDDGNVPGIRLFQSGGEALGIAHGFQEQRDRSGGLVLQHVVHEVGGRGDEFLARRDEQAIGCPGVVGGKRQEQRSRVTDEPDRAGLEFAGFVPARIDAFGGMKESHAIAAAKRHSRLAGDLRRRSVNNGGLSPSRYALAKIVAARQPVSTARRNCSSSMALATTSTTRSAGAGRSAREG